MSKPRIDSAVSGWTTSSCSPQSILRPAERSEAKATTSPAGNARSRMMPSIVEPTAPVAPTTATPSEPPLRRRAERGLGLDGLAAELERACSSRTACTPRG